MPAAATPTAPRASDRPQAKVRRTARRLALLALVALGLAVPPAASASVKPSEPQLRHALDRVIATGVPGAVVLAREGGRTITLAGGFGNVKQQTATRASDRFRVGSVTKTFVATLVLRLVADRKLALDDTVEQRLPGVVPNGGSITVRQLLNMTSGLFDYLNDGDSTVDRTAARAATSPTAGRRSR